MKKPSIILFYFHDINFIYDFISRVPKNRLDDVIIASPSFKNKILGRNMVDSSGIEDYMNAGDDLADAILVVANSSGINIEYTLKNIMQILLLAENTSLDNYLNVLDKSDSIGNRIRQEARQKTKSRHLIKFIEEVERKSIDSTAIHNKFKRIFGSTKVMPFCEYTGRNLFDYKEVVENGKILIYYLGGIGDAGTAIASIELVRIYNHFFSYSDVNPIPFFPTYIVIDEAQRIMARGVSNSIREQRKHGIRYILSTQSLSGVDAHLKQAYELLGSLGYFSCPESDAKFFSQSTGGEIKSRDLMALDKYEMFVKILSSNNVFKCNTLPFIAGDMEKVEYVIKNSLEKYYLDPDVLEQQVKSNLKPYVVGGRPKIGLSGLSDELKKITGGK